MKGLLSLSRGIDAINTWIGRTVSWLILAAVMLSAANAVARKLFSASSNAWLEAQWYLFGTVFLLCAAWTLLSNEHIRIDVVSSHLPQRARNWIDVIGHTFFLIPLCILVLWDGWPFFTRSFEQNEQSMNAGGLPLWPAKFVVVAGFFFLLLQAVSELIKRIAIMRGDLQDSAQQQDAVEAEAERLLAQAQADGFADTPKN